MALLDTTALIDLTRGSASASKQRLRAALAPLMNAGQTPCTSRVNEAGLWVGEFRVPAQAVAITPCLRRWSSWNWTRSPPGGPPNSTPNCKPPAARPADMLIAAVALANGQSLVTRDVRHFATVPGLTVIGY